MEVANADDEMPPSGNLRVLAKFKATSATYNNNRYQFEERVELRPTSATVCVYVCVCVHHQTHPQKVGSSCVCVRGGGI